MSVVYLLFPFNGTVKTLWWATVVSGWMFVAFFHSPLSSRCMSRTWIMKKRWKGVFSSALVLLLSAAIRKSCSKTWLLSDNHVLLHQKTLIVFSVNMSYPVYYVSFVFSYIYAHTHIVYLLGLEVSYPMPFKILHIFKRESSDVKG